MREMPQPIPTRHVGDAPIRRTSTLTVRHIGPDGKPAQDAESVVIGLDLEVREQLSSSDGTAVAALPAGQYILVSDIVDADGNWHRLVHPAVALDQDATIAVDARTTRPVTVTIDRPEARLTMVDLAFERRFGEKVFNVSLPTAELGRLYTAHLGPELSAEEMTSGLATTWGVPGPDGDFRNTPYSYHLLDTVQGRFFTGFERTAVAEELATLTAQHNTQVSARTGVKGWFGKAEGFASVSGTLLPYDLPARTVHYLDTRDTEWSGAFGEQVPDENGYPAYVTAMGSDYQRYEARQEYSERWNSAPYGPFLFRPDHAARRGDTIWFGVPLYTDQENHRAGSVVDRASIRLYRDRELVGESPGGQLVTQVSPGKASFRAEAISERPSVFGLSTRAEVTWTFSSAATKDAQPLPLWTVRFFPEVDAYNRVRAGGLVDLPIAAQPMPEAEVGTVADLTLAVSGDEGASWQPVTVAPVESGRFVAAVPVPADARSLSLRTELRDSQGNTVQQKIINAVYLAATDRPDLPTLPAQAVDGSGRPVTSDTQSACLTRPTTPAAARGGFRIRTSAHNDCRAPTTFWLVRYNAGRSAWHTITEEVVMPGTTGALDWPSRGTGTYVYRAIQFDPNMHFNKMTPPVEITC